MTRISSQFTIGIMISLFAGYGCGGNSPAGTGANSERHTGFGTGGSELGSLLGFSVDQQQQLEVSLVTHTNRTNALLEHARASNLDDVQMMLQMQIYKQVFCDGFFESLTPVQFGKYDTVSKNVLSNYYQSGQYPTTGLHRLILFIEHAEN